MYCNIRVFWSPNSRPRSDNFLVIKLSKLIYLSWKFQFGCWFFCLIYISHVPLIYSVFLSWEYILLYLMSDNQFLESNRWRRFDLFEDNNSGEPSNERPGIPLQTFIYLHCPGWPDMQIILCTINCYRRKTVYANAIIFRFFSRVLLWKVNLWKHAYHTLLNIMASLWNSCNHTFPYLTQ